jgi:hypothetical protein
MTSMSAHAAVGRNRVLTLMGSIAIASLLALLPSVAQAQNLEWFLLPSSCSNPDPGAVLVISCGDHGIFQFGGIAPSRSDCLPQASGNQILEGRFYPPPAERISLFPGTFSSVPPTAPLGKVVVLDFRGEHGKSVRWLAGALAGDVDDTSFFALDDPQLAPLGSAVSDLHVLATVCRVENVLATSSGTPPTVINMSFGRFPVSSDPVSANSCSVDSAACQIAKVIKRLADRGSLPIASGGNHKVRLFPATLAGLVKPGMVDTKYLLKSNISLPAWETPPLPPALLPGAAFCVDHWPAAPGSSYSTGMLSGWIAGLSLSADAKKQLVHRNWHAERLPPRNCWELVDDLGKKYGCNKQAEEIFKGLGGKYVTDCWVSSSNVATITTGGTPPALQIAPQPIDDPSFDEWFSDQTNPTPAADPCVPCVGSYLGADFKINLSQSGVLQGNGFSTIALVTGSSQYTIPLSPAQLQQIAQGQVGTLILQGWGPAIPSWPQPSLRFTVDNYGSPYWTSAPIVISP